MKKAAVAQLDYPPSHQTASTMTAFGLSISILWGVNAPKA
jgi:hypothetical protein